MTGRGVAVVVLASIGGLIIGFWISVAVIRTAIGPLADNVRRLADRLAPFGDEDD